MSHLIFTWASKLVHIELCFKQGRICLSSIAAVLHWSMVCGPAIIQNAPADEAGWKRTKGPTVYHVRRSKCRVVCEDPAMPCKGKADRSGTVSQRCTGLLINTLGSMLHTAKSCPTGQEATDLWSESATLAEVSGIVSLRHKHPPGQRRTSRQGVGRVWRVVSHELLPLNSCDPPDQQVA